MKKIHELNLEQPAKIHPEANMQEIAQLLQEHRHIFVVKDNKPLGIISAADIIAKAIAKNKTLLAKELMTTKISYAKTQDTAAEALRQMLRLNHYSLPILNKEELKGIITMDECLRGMR